MGNDSSLLRHLDHAKKTGVCVLKEQKLSEFPQDLLQLKVNLRTLDLSLNRLQHLPPMVGQFGHLKILNLSHNKLTTLPEDIGELRKLENLNLEDNNLTSLPDSCVNLKALKSVNLSSNKLSAFPLFLCQLIQLDMVDLSSNSLTELPRDVECLTAVELNVSRNSVGTLPAELARCRRLKVLRAEENSLPLMGVPPAILSESCVSLLCLEGNLFDAQELRDMAGYDKYMERFSAVRRKTD